MRKKLKNFFGKKLAEINRHIIVVLTLVAVLLIMVAVIFIKPRLEKGNGWLGITVRQDPTKGVLVIKEIIAGSPAYNVGMLKGDVILSYESIAISDTNTLKLLIRDSYINEVVRIILERNSMRLVANTRIARRPEHVRISPPVLSIVQGTPSPHENRGLCVSCHTLIPPNRK